MALPLIMVIALAGAAALLPVLARRRAGASAPAADHRRDPVRDARAERRARELLRAAAGDEVAATYDQLGFVEVAGRRPGYGYLIYPHRPIVAYDTESGELLSEYCVRFPDAGAGGAGRWLPDADDVLAKWLGLSADEHRLIGESNLHLLGRQHDPEMVRRDLAALRSWRAARLGGPLASLG